MNKLNKIEIIVSIFPSHNAMKTEINYKKKTEPKKQEKCGN